MVDLQEEITIRNTDLIVLFDYGEISLINHVHGFLPSAAVLFLNLECSTSNRARNSIRELDTSRAMSKQSENINSVTGNISFSLASNNLCSETRFRWSEDKLIF